MVTRQKEQRATGAGELPHRMPVGELRHGLGISRRVFSRLTGFSERAIANWEGGRTPSESTRQRMIEIQRLQQ